MPVNFLYLAEIELLHQRYMGSERRKKITRIVWAHDEASAEQKIRNEFEHCEPGDDSCHVSSIALHQAL